MNHLVLARKYRPKLFEQVVGQDVIVATLKAAILKDRMAHALLFTGGRGIGKTTIARIVAKALVCLDRQEAEPCGLCAQCLGIDNFSSLDVIEIDGASHTGVDDVRDLRDSARYQPTSAKYKIFIIDEVHMLSTSAFNALLKIVEEPPPHVIFMFATTEAHKIPKTIISRCQRYDFKRMSIEVMLKTLRAIMVQENIDFEDAGLLLIAQLADGGLRDALSMTEQILTEKRAHYSALDVANALGVVSHQAIREVADAVMMGQVEPALKVLSQVYEQGLDLCQMMDALTERFRVLSLCAHLDGLSKAQSILPGIESQDFNEAKGHDPADLKRLFAMSLDGMAQVFGARKPLLALELFILRVALRPPISDATTINFGLQKLEAMLSNRPLPKEPSAPPVLKAALASRPMPRTTPKPIEPLDFGRQFAGFVEELSKSSPGIASYLRHARPHLGGENVLKLNFEMSLYYEKVLMHKNNPEFLANLARVFGSGLKLELVLDKAPVAEIRTVKTVAETHEAKKVAQELALQSEASGNPLVKKALEIFGGNIAEVKKLDTHEIV